MSLESSTKPDQKEEPKASSNAEFPKKENVGDESPGLEHFGSNEVEEQRTGESKVVAQH